MYEDRNSGRKYSQKQIDRYKARAAKLLFERQREEYGYNFCEECRHNGTEWKLDPAHIKSVAHCKNDKEIEKIWSVENHKVLCRKCHREYDGLDLQFSHS